MKILAPLAKSYKPDNPNYISGVDFWRIERPMMALREATGWQIDIKRKVLPGKAEVGTKATERAFANIGINYDLVYTSYFSSQAGANAYAYFRVLEPKFGLKFAMDLDDNFIYMNPSNPATLYFKEGSKEMHILKVIMTDVEWLTATTPRLTQFYQDYRTRYGRGGPKDPATTMQINNYIDTTVWPITRPPQRPRKDVHIVYMGSSHHHGDLNHSGFLAAVMRILDKYPNVRFTCVGMPPLNPAELDENEGYAFWKHDRLTYHPGAGLYEGYMDLFKSLKPDIYCAPLEANYFNSQKSNIKMQEAALSGGAFVASDVNTYSDDVKRNETGVLVGNTRLAWQMALEDLIMNPRKRRELAQANQDYVMEQWALDKNIWRYKEMFEHIMASDKVTA